jgi:hypothetical protein
MVIYQQTYFRVHLSNSIFANPDSRIGKGITEAEFHIVAGVAGNVSTNFSVTCSKCQIVQSEKEHRVCLSLQILSCE